MKDENNNKKQMARMQYKGFEASIKYSVSDKIYWGKVVGVTDSITFEGNKNNIKHSFREAIKHYINTCESIGK